MRHCLFAAGETPVPQAADAQTVEVKVELGKGEFLDIPIIDERHCPENSFEFSSSSFGSKKRKCQHDWFRKYNWLHYEVALDIVLSAMFAFELPTWLADTRTPCGSNWLTRLRF